MDKLTLKEIIRRRVGITIQQPKKRAAPVKNQETSAEFIARGGYVQKIGIGISGKPFQTINQRDGKDREIRK